MGAILEIRRILGLDSETDEKLKTYWTAPDVAPLNLAMGAVKNVLNEKGYAFVTRYGGGRDVFLHARALPPGDFEKLAVGTVLTYRVKETDKGHQATDVEFVSGALA